MNKQLCERCGLSQRYQHPKTAKIFKLCASCGWKALTGRQGYDTRRFERFVYFQRKHGSRIMTEADYQAKEQNRE